MPDFNFSVLRRPIAVGKRIQVPHDTSAMVLVHAGRVLLNGAELASGAGVFARAGAILEGAGEEGAEVIAFVLSQTPIEGAEATETVDISFPCLWRLDEVSFPPGAVAYRHIHPGPGFRHLRLGHLHLQADDHAFDATPGTTWFENVNSPVRATTDTDMPETRFVRSMILPVTLQSKPSINILDPEDAARPKRQVTHRHVDQIISHLPQVDAG